MDKKRYRISAFDDLIKGRPITKYGEGLAICDTFGEKDGIQLDPDIIDRFFEEFYTSKYHISLQVGYCIPGKVEITIPITQREHLSWMTENKDGKLYVKVKTVLTDEEYGHALESLRANGNKINMIKLGEYDYIDYGELSPECVIRFSIDPSLPWHLRSESIRIPNRDPDVPPSDGNMISLTAQKYPDIGKKEDYAIEQSGIVFIAFATGCSLFTEEQLKDAKEEKDMTQEASVTVHTDEDCELPDPPEGYEPIEDNVTDENREAVAKYNEDLKAAVHRRTIWQVVFSSSDPFIRSMFNTWVSTLTFEDCVGEQQIHLADFEAWLKENDAYAKFMECIKNSMKNKMQRSFDINLDAIVVEKEQIETYKQILDIAKTYGDKMQQLAKDMKIDMSNANVVDPKFSLMLQNLPEVKQYERLGFLLATDLAKKNNLLTTPDTDTDNPVIKYILLHLPDIMNKYIRK
jgi:hypothetical protein